MVRRSRYLLLGLMIVLVFSGIPNAECSTNDTMCEMHALDVGGIDPPSIRWMFDENATVATGVHYDSIYQGQTEWNWSYSSWISDSDGVDTVFFQYRHSRNDEWMNKTPTLVSGHATRGEYSYTFVQKIWWDWEANRPQMDGGGFYTEFRIFANDSLGNWRTTLATFRDGGWMGITPPLSPLAIPPEVWLFTSTLAVVVVATLVIYRRRR